MHEGIFINNDGDMLRGLHVFNVLVGDPEYTTTVLKTKATQMRTTTRNYVADMADDHPQELWTMLQYSLQHKTTYWLRTCTTSETEEKASLVDSCILEALKVSTCIDYE
jgi:hypothetical protein